MKHKAKRTGLLTRLSLLTLAFLLGGMVAFAQGNGGSNLSGRYEGMVKRPGGPEEKISLELKSEGGKISGRATHGDKSAEVTEAKLENGTLTLSFGNDATFIAKVDGDKLVGEAVHGTEKIPMELKKVTPAAAPAAAPATAAAPAAAPATAPAPAPATAPAAATAAVNLTGQWDAVADANGQPFPFLLTLKIDGENVSGGSSSQLGEASIKSGKWKDGRLSFDLEGQNGTISMSATIIEGKLSGEFDYAGQLSGKWVAVKKN